MNRFFLGGALALALSVSGLLAQPKPKSQGEVDAIKALFNAQDPDARIAAAENLLNKYADTEFKSIALFAEADAYERKRDYEHTIIFGERTLEADPKNYQAMLLLAQNIAQHTKEFDLDKDEKLAKADKYANGAIEALKDAQKPNPNLTDDQWNGVKKEMVGQAHAALGMTAMVRKKPDVAENEFKSAMESGDKPDPGLMVRLGMAYSQDGKYDEAIAQFDKVMAMPDANPQYKQYAQAERVRAMQKKNPKPAAPAAPAAPAPTTPPAAGPAPEPEKKP